MANINVISMEELSTSLETIDWKLCFICEQIGKDDLQDPMVKKSKFSLLYKQILAVVFVLNRWLSGPFKADLSDQSHISKYCTVPM